jgi:nonribosomal peptide synthetase CepB
MTVVPAGHERVSLIWTGHHVISDGWSQAVLRQELFVTYAAIRRGSLLGALSDRPDGYLTAVQEAARAVTDGEYWRDFKGWRSPLSLSRRARARSHQYRELHLPDWQRGLLAERGRRSNASYSSVVVTAVAAAVGRLTGEDEVVIAVVVNGRNRVPHPDSSVGCFVNTLPVRLPVEATDGNLVGEVHARLAGLAERSGDRQEEICRAAAVGSIQDLTGVMFLYQSYPEVSDADALTLGEVEVVKYDGSETYQFPLVILYRDLDGGGMLELHYETDWLEPELVELLVEHLESVVVDLTESE